MAAQPATFAEAMGKIVSDISQASLLPDADPQFLAQLQGVIVGYMRQKAGGGQPGQQQGQPGGMGMGAGAPGMSPPGAPDLTGGGGGMMQGAPTPNGVQPLAQMPNPDELRRMIQTSVGGGQ